MVSQEEWPIDASARSGLFSPAPGSFLDIDVGLSPGSRKRKWDGDTINDLLDDSFSVKPYPSTVFTKPRTLKPIALLHRSHLPLSYIDIHFTINPLPDSRLFETHVKILELEDRMGNKPMLVIARLDDGKSIYAVERDSRGLYVLCKLGSWVNLEKLCGEAVVSRHQFPTKNTVEQSSQIQSGLNKSDSKPESNKYSKKKRLAIEAIQSMVKRSSTDRLATIQLTTPTEAESTEISTSLAKEERFDEALVDEPVVQPVASEIFDSVRLQYLETLYLSKASLGYFAKGPLSRARAAFHLDYDSTLDMNDLIAFLESLILPTSVLDKKYKDGLPEIVSTLAMGEGSADEAEMIKGDPKKRKSKKMRLGKNGLYPTETNYLRRWWASDDDEFESGTPGRSKDEIGRKRVAQLRIRETQLQMIVILETLALQPLAMSQGDQEGDLPFGSMKDEAGDIKLNLKSKAKRKRDFPGLIDVHVDRLCIWQSLAAEEGKTASDRGIEPGGGAGDLANAHRHAADVLREFCVEVIAPFFSARLPEQCGVISRKLGGPAVASTPARPKLAKSASISAVLTRPGAVAKRPATVKARRSLQRVLTDERSSRNGSRGSSGAISLMRSATAPLIPGLKREASEAPSFSNIPTAETQTMHVSRGGVMKSKKFSQREVDLSNMVNATDAKAKKASIEAELRDAITALQRPNRQLAGQLQVDSAEHRASTAMSHSRKSKKPVRNPLFQGVQILATPKLNRRKDVDTSNPPSLAPDLRREYDSQIIPASSAPRVPQSVARSATRSSGSFGICKATPVQSRSDTNAPFAIEGTPSRAAKQPQILDSFGSSKGFLGYDVIPPSSPSQSRHDGKYQTLSVPGPLAEEIENFRTPTRPSKIQATPVKQTASFSVEMEISSQIVKSVLLPRGMKKDGTENIGKSVVEIDHDDSIYKSLGWDDDFDDF